MFEEELHAFLEAGVLLQLGLADHETQEHGDHAHPRADLERDRRAVVQDQLVVVEAILLIPQPTCSPQQANTATLHIIKT